MKTFLAILAATTSLALGGQALAHPQLDHGLDHEPGWRGEGRYDDQSGWREADRRLAIIDARIERGARRGDLTPHEVRRLRDDVRDVARLQRRFGRDGHFSYGERVAMDQELDRLETQVRRQRHDRDYGYGYGRPDRRW